jgi:hypothetical protein
MARFGDLPRRERALFPKSARSEAPDALDLLKDEQGSSLLEFAIVVPLLVVFVVGIYDFSAAFNQKQKIEQAAQEGAIVAGAQPMGDIAIPPPPGPSSLLPVVNAIFNSLAGSGVLPNANTGTCKMPPPVPTQAALAWTYTVPGCSSAFAGDNLAITINRGQVSAGGPPVAVETVVSVTYPYHWRFGSVIQLLFPPGPNGYAAPAQITESATVHNQM